MQERKAPQFKTDKHFSIDGKKFISFYHAFWLARNLLRSTVLNDWRCTKLFVSEFRMVQPLHISLNFWTSLRTRTQKWRKKSVFKIYSFLASRHELRKYLLERSGKNIKIWLTIEAPYLEIKHKSHFPSFNYIVSASDILRVMYVLWYITLVCHYKIFFCQPVSPEGADLMHPFIPHDTPWTQIQAFCVRWSLPPSPPIKLLQPLRHCKVSFRRTALFMVWTDVYSG